MPLLSILFYLFATVLVVSAAMVVTIKNPVKAALFLVLSFFSAACIWMTLEAEFLSIALVLVYVGAVMVLFLFVVMMLDIDIERMREGFARNMPVGALVAGISPIYRLCFCIRSCRSHSARSNYRCHSVDDAAASRYPLPVSFRASQSQ